LTPVRSARATAQRFPGFSFCHAPFLDIKIDYRDALIGFSYDRKRFDHF